MDISILRYLDVLIGFAVVMILASSFVTLLTQFALDLLKKRAEFLQQGLAALLKSGHPSLNSYYANEIAHAVLTWNHTSGKPGAKRGVVEREQLIIMLLEMATSPSDSSAQVSPTIKKFISDMFADAAGQNPLLENLINQPDSLTDDDKALVKALLEKYQDYIPECVEALNISESVNLEELEANLQNNQLGVSDLAVMKAILNHSHRIDHARSLLEQIDRTVCEMEAAHPEFATHVIRTRAIVQANAGRFVDALMTRFDNMSESLTALYSSHSRTWSFIISLVIALALPLDTVDLLKRLSSDDELRQAMVSKAIEINQSAQAKQTAAIPQAVSADGAGEGKKPSAIPATASPAKPATLEGDIQAIKQAYAELANLSDPKLDLVSRGGWRKIANAGQIRQTLFGCLLSAMLMTIGAPFWFEMLKNLLKFRPGLAVQDDVARSNRRADETGNAN